MTFYYKIFSMNFLVLFFIFVFFNNFYAQDFHFTNEDYKDVHMFLRLLGIGYSIDEVKQLKSLDLSYNSEVKDDNLSYLKYLTTLTTIDLSNTNISDKGFSLLGKLSLLTEINISNTNISDDSVGFISVFKKLKKINITNSNISYEGFLSLKKSIPGVIIIGYDEKSKTALSSGKKLTKSQLSNFKDVQKWLDSYELYYSLEKIAFLEKLNLRGEKIFKSDISPIVKLVNLKELSLTNTDIDDNSLSYIKDLQSLEVLYLTGTSITDKGLLHLKNLKNLKVLYLNGTEITNSGLKHLSFFKNLVKLSLANLKTISDSGFVYFRKNNNLRLLDVRGTRITKNATFILNDYLQDLTIFI